MVPAKSCVTNGEGKWKEWTYLERGVFQRELARKGKVPSRTEQGRQTSKRPLQFGTVWHDGGRVATEVLLLWVVRERVFEGIRGKHWRTKIGRP